MILYRTFIGVCLAVCAPAVGWCANADAVGTFYSGRQVRIIVGSDVGGGYDLYCRLLARHLGAHIPGNPSVLVFNMPGAAGVIAANYLANRAPKDGTEVLMDVQTIPVAQLAGGDSVRFDLAQFNWIGSMSDDTNVIVTWHTSGVKSIEDALQQPIIVGATGITSMESIYPKVLNNALGAKIKIVYGYKSGTAIDLAMERGEVQGRAGISWSSLKAARRDRLQRNELNVLLQMGVRKEPDLVEVPLMVELARNDTQRHVLQFYSSLTSVARALAAPPGTPSDRVETLRAAFDETLNDPEFQADAGRLGLGLHPIDGQSLQRLVGDIVSADAAILDYSR